MNWAFTGREYSERARWRPIARSRRADGEQPVAGGTRRGKGRVVEFARNKRQGAAGHPAVNRREKSPGQPCFIGLPASQQAEPHHVSLRASSHRVPVTPPGGQRPVRETQRKARSLERGKGQDPANSRTRMTAQPSPATSAAGRLAPTRFNKHGHPARPACQPEPIRVPGPAFHSYTGGQITVRRS